MTDEIGSDFCFSPSVVLSMASRKTSWHIDDEVLRETRGDGIKLTFIGSSRLSSQPANASNRTALGEDVDTEVENDFIVLLEFKQFILQGAYETLVIVKH